MSVIAKFGGSSIANAPQIQNAISIVKHHLNGGVVMVASAMGKTTDELVEIIDLSIEGHRARGIAALNQIRERHLHELESIVDHHIRLHGVKRIELLCDEMQAVCIEMTTQKRGTDLQRAYLLAHGELLATTVIYAMARSRGVTCKLLDSRELIKTDSQPLKAEIYWEKTEKQIKKQIDLAAKALYIAQGFIASSQEGRTTTLGRGGSDYSAALIGAALSVDKIEIWTDVDGIMTADPRIVRGATPINGLSYSEAAELAYFGATVIHPSTMVPAIRHGIPLIVRNTNNPTHKGTRIARQTKQSGVRAIATKSDVTVINIQSYRMLNAYGFLDKIFTAFADYQTAVDIIATSEVSVSLTIDDSHNVPLITDRLAQFAKVEVRDGQSIVSVVAHGLWKDARVVSRVFGALDAIPIQLVTLGGSDTNLSMVMDRRYAERAVKALHSVFFEK